MEEHPKEQAVIIKETYKVKEIAKILDISLREAYKICEENPEFKVIRIGTRGIRVHKQSFDKWFHS